MLNIALTKHFLNMKHTNVKVMNIFVTSWKGKYVFLPSLKGARVLLLYFENLELKKKKKRVGENKKHWSSSNTLKT